MPELTLGTATAYGAHRLIETRPLKVQKVQLTYTSLIDTLRGCGSFT